MESRPIYQTTPIVALDPAQQASAIMSKATYASATGTIIAGITLTEWGVIVGILCTLLTFAANLWFKWQHLKLARAKLEADEDE